MRLLSVSEAAKIVGITPGLLRRYLREGRLAFKWIGGVRVVDDKEARAFANVKRKKGRP
jgi:predicted site-specific integrase-resolvase